MVNYVDEQDQRGTAYSFDAFIKDRSELDWYQDDLFLQRLIKYYVKDEFAQLNAELMHFSPKVSGLWNNIAEKNAEPEVHPAIQHYDAFNHRIDRIVRPQAIHELEKGVFGEGLFSKHTLPWESFTKRMLIHQLGEAGVTCPMTCTNGLIALIEHFPEPANPALEEILLHAKEGRDMEYAIGAQFMSEIQGGSDLPSNVLEAVPDGANFRLYGNKFFCSVAHADYAVVTARVAGTNHIRPFIVPAWLDGEKSKERRNGHQLNRLKRKMGTCELPTAEIQYDGALAYPIGPADKGIAVAVGIVLTISRLEIGMACASFMLRAVREAKLYADFREVFGQKINMYPLAASQLNRMEHTAHRTAAGVFKIYDFYLKLEKPLNPGLSADKPLAVRKQLFDLRELILLQKITVTKEAGDILRDAISIYGGHGVMEDFTSLPRIFRDIIVNEQWEGPRNLLLTQIYRDISRVADWYSPADFIGSILTGAPANVITEFAERLTILLEEPVIGVVNEQSLAAAEHWDLFCDQLFKAYQETALKQVNAENR